ncbi:MAG: CDP-diacylglycerol--serine O-phosphatidyltransferase [Bacteroidales bacterium]|nr:CDP-diacylglycerol--serine O-phosphatidyltransferase [Bacteroidales bacterium]MBN2818413.1 CDP-diacylglycerol--serine O-phosphatidyltransferase [Bacteroidales bacterium]
MKSTKYIIPNTITCLNLLAGSLAIVFAIAEYIMLPVYLLLAAAVFDFLDGLTAKLLHATSEFGKQLDSLADLISFGLAPSILMFKLMYSILNYDAESFFSIKLPLLDAILLYSTFIIVISAALRLARFNITVTSSPNFIGLPVPAATLILVSVWLTMNVFEPGNTYSLFYNKWILIAIVFGVSVLMVSTIPMLSLKLKNLSIKDNLWEYALIIGAIILFAIYRFESLLSIMLYYVLLSLAKAVSYKFQSA